MEISLELIHSNAILNSFIKFKNDKKESYSNHLHLLIWIIKVTFCKNSCNLILQDYFHHLTSLFVFLLLYL